MKTNIIYFALILFAVSCTTPDPLEEKQNALKEYKATFKEAQDSITSLEAQIALLLGDSIVERNQVVTIQPATIDTFQHFVSVHGEAEASNNIMVHPEVAGTITSIVVKEGQKVSKGQTLVSVDAAVMENNIAELENQLEFATTLYEKQKRLYDQNIGSEVQYLQAKNTKESLENSLATMRSQVGKFYIKSPISGTVDEIFPHSGESANPAMPVARIVNLDRVFIEADLSESYLGKVNVGDAVKLEFRSIDVNMTGRIAQVGQFISENNRTFKIKVALDEDNALIRPNLLAIVTFMDYENPAAMAYPSKIVLEDLKGKYVYVSVEENVDGTVHPVAKKKYVTTGEVSEGYVELFGLEENDQVIIEGFNDLSPDEKLDITMNK